MWRAGFGPKSDSLNLLSFDTLKLWKQILADSTEADVPAIKVVDDSNLLVDGNIKTIRNQKAQKPAAEYADQSNRSGLDRQNGIFTAATSGKGFFFWMGHFASRIQNSNFNQDH